MKALSKTLIAVLSLGAIGWSGIRIYEHTVAVTPAEIHLGTAPLMPTSDPNGFSPFQVVPPFPAITNAPVVTGRQVSGEVTDNELVLGVELNGEARAYPINMLTGPDREIINDRLGGVAIAATW